MADIYVDYSRVWDFYEDNHDRLKYVQAKIAENKETKHAVCLTDKNDLPRFTVYWDDQKIEEAYAVSYYDCMNVVRGLYQRYLFPVVEGVPDSQEENTAEEARDDLIYEREDELRLATIDFLSVLLGCDAEEVQGDYLDVIDEFLENACQNLADEFNISVYRPTLLTDDETGSDIYVEYPYLDIDVEVETDEKK